VPDGSVTLGYRGHAVLEGCEHRFLVHCERLSAMFADASEQSGFNVDEVTSHEFEPDRAACVLIPAQSHLIGHSWPECGVLVLDIFTCGRSEEVEMTIDAVRRLTNATRVMSELHIQAIKDPERC
jgi:S-adenosylmethionine decarboxylase